MKFKEFVKKIEEFCPLNKQEEWDNCGVQIFTGNEDIEKVLIAMEVTSEVIEEAVVNEVDMIITHHPLIFGSINQVDVDDVTGNFIQRLIAADINVYSCHTNFDRIFGGNNDFLGNVLGIDSVAQKGDEILRHGWYMRPESLAQLIDLYAFKLNIDKRHFKFVGNLDKPISKVAICTGAGAEYIKEAVNDGCDLMITGDVKYHDARMAKELGINVLDIGHYASEKIFVDAFMSFIIASDIDEDMFILSDLDINPFTLI